MESEGQGRGLAVMVEGSGLLIRRRDDCSVVTRRGLQLYCSHVCTVVSTAVLHCGSGKRSHDDLGRALYGLTREHELLWEVRGKIPPLPPLTDAHLRWLERSPTSLTRLTLFLPPHHSTRARKEPPKVTGRRTRLPRAGDARRPDPLVRLVALEVRRQHEITMT